MKLMVKNGHNQIKIAIKVLLFLFISIKIYKEKRENPRKE